MQITKSLLAAVLMFGPAVLAAPADVSRCPIFTLGEKATSHLLSPSLFLLYAPLSLRRFTALY